MIPPRTAVAKPRRATRPTLEILEDRTTPSVVPFTPAGVIGAGLDGASSLTAADVSGNGHPDLVFGAYGANVVGWVENLGGTFGPVRVIDAEADSVWFTRPVDVDGDGRVDVIAGMYSGTFALYRNLGGGEFGPREVIESDFFGPWLGTGDFDGDGHADLLAGEDGGGELFLFSGRGDGTFVKSLLDDGFGGLGGIQVGDVTGNGLPDAVVGDYGSGQLRVYLNVGGVLTPGPVIDGGDAASAQALADFNGDGHLDVLSLEYGSDKVAWHAGDGTGSFGPRQELPADLDGPYALKAADFNGDGSIDVAIATFGSSPELVWLANDGSGNFGPPMRISQAAGQVGALEAFDFDGDGDLDLVAHSFSRGEMLLFTNRLGEFATTVSGPTPRTYSAGQNLDIVVHFGVPVTVRGEPRILLRVGERTVPAVFVGGSGGPELVFRYTVAATDLDSDGIELASRAVAANGGSLTGPDGRPVDLRLPGIDLRGVRVNGAAPTVRAVERLDATPTNAEDVRFRVTFSKPVVGVGAAAFQPAGDVSGAAVTAVEGSGREYVVTVSTGGGSGVLGLTVSATAPVADADGNRLADGFEGGEVYTLARRSQRVIDDFYESGHGDIVVGFSDSAWNLRVHADNLGDFAPGEVMMYGGPSALTARPGGAAWDFLGVGAGEMVYVWPQNGSIPDLPEVGLSGEGIAGGTFARYFNTDPRRASEGAWVEVRLAGVRGPEGGELALYQTGAFGDPIVWFATADGIDERDAVWILEGSHQHFSWAFTRPGVYEVDVITSGFLDVNGNGVFDPGVDPYTESGVITLYFGVDLPGGPQPFVIEADPMPEEPPVVPPPELPEPPQVPEPPVVPLPPELPVPPQVPAPPVVTRPAVAVSTPGSPTVRLLAEDGTELGRIDPFPGFTGPIHVAMADLNGDGIADMIFAAGTGGGPHVRVIDGATGEELLSFFAFDPAFTGGVFLAVGDVTGDGLPEIVVSAGLGGGPHVAVFDGRTGAALRGFFAYDAAFRGGVRVALGDLDGDGVLDILTGTVSGAPHVRGFDGPTGAAVLGLFAGDDPMSQGGVSVAAGVLEPGRPTRVVAGTGTGRPSQLLVYSASGAEVGRAAVYDPDFTGGVRVAVTDFDGDGVSDIVVGPGEGGGPHLKLFRGGSPREVASFLAGDADSFGGVFVG